MSNSKIEPWLRGTHTDIPAIPRAVIHAIELAKEDLQTWCSDLTEEELHNAPANLPSVAEQILHIARSIDRLLTYAEGRSLGAEQLWALSSESDARCSRDQVFAELEASLTKSLERVQQVGGDGAILEQPRTVGRQQLPSTVAGLLVHVADHTQRHVGQAIITAKLVRALRH